MPSAPAASAAPTAAPAPGITAPGSITTTDAPESSTPEEIALEKHRRARELGTAALKLFREDHYEDAYPLFRQADEEWHTPQLVLYMARCQSRRGKLMEGRALYERVLSEAPAESPSESAQRARGAAAEELGELRLRISTLAIDVRGPPPEEITLFVDGEVWPIAEPRELDPGSHEVEAIARSGARTSRSMDVPEGRAMSTILRLGLFAPSASRSSSAEPAPEPSKWPLIASGVAFGVAGAALSVGAVTGFLVVGKGSFLGQECIERPCSPSQREELNSLRALGDVSTASFILAGIGAATGAVLVVVGRASNKGNSSVVTARAVAAPGAAMVEGRF